MALHNTSSTDAWAQAVSTHAHLLANGRLTQVDAPTPALVPEPGEYAVAVIPGGMTFARYASAQVVYGGTGSSLVVGSQPFVTGYVLGSLFQRGRRRRRVRREAAPQWRPTPLLRVVVTTRRLWCEVATDTGPTWLNFNYDTIADLRLDGAALVLSFLQAEPLRLSGELAPWCAAVIAHYRFGPSAPAAVPALHAAALAG
ncbi:hypothetical protein [Actinokineospora enzanensis]|uniref:hypothetical protein n=1 Tax=Actinokineospora enzanensis TaxID=155975 RepID=UPI000365E3E3|nr:hypothetical protein [Actinokineospora enzanensis]